MQYLLPCDKCGKKHEVEPSQAGGQIACVCSHTIEVPSLRGLRELETAEPTTTLPSTRSLGAGRTREMTGRVICVVGLFVFAIGLATAAFGGLIWMQIHVPPVPIDQTEAAAAAIDDMTASESLGLWMDFREHGVGHYQMPEHEAVAQFANFYWQVMAVGIGLIVVGLLAATIPLLLSRRAER